MKPRNFALVVGGAVLAAFVLCMLIPSCGGGDGYQADDFFTEYYADCVSVCTAVEEWEVGCGSPHAKMADDCVEHLWWKGYAQEYCVRAALCWEAMASEEICWEESSMFVEDGWYPPMFEGQDCPAQVP